MEPINEEPLDFLFKRAWGPDSIWDELKQKWATGTGQTTPESPDQPIQTNPTQTTPEVAQEMTPKTSYSMENIKPEEKAPFYGIKLMVAKFQIWYNRNMGGSLAVDGIWGKNTQAAWDNWVTKTYPEKKQEETLPSIDEEKTNHHTKTMNEEMFKTMVKEIIKERMDKNNQNTKNTGVMKVKLNEETLNAYIQEAIRQELDEGKGLNLLSKIFSKSRKAGKKPGALKRAGRWYWDNLTGNKKKEEKLKKALDDNLKQQGALEQAKKAPVQPSGLVGLDGKPLQSVGMDNLKAKQADIEKQIRQMKNRTTATRIATGAAATTAINSAAYNAGQNN